MERCFQFKVLKGLFARQYNSSCKNKLNLNAVELTANGDIKRLKFSIPKTEFCLENGLQVRDLRQLEVVNRSIPTLPPSILSRGNSILVSMVFTKAIIQYNSVKFFDASMDEGDPRFFDKFLSDLQELIKTKQPLKEQNHQMENINATPFEFIVLECLLDHISRLLSVKLESLQSTIENLLVLIEREIDRKSLKGLLLFSKDLTKFLSIATGIRDSIDELLKSDSDMAKMYLSNKKSNNIKNDRSAATKTVKFPTTKLGKNHTQPPSPVMKSSTAPPIINPPEQIDHNQQQLLQPIMGTTANDRIGIVDEHEELELLLEHFLRILDELVGRGEDLLQNIQSTEGISNIVLDSQRNALLRLELKLTMASLSLGCGGLGAGFFGMNLHSSFEHHPHAFYAAVGGLTLISGGVLWACWKKMSLVIKDSL